MSWFLGYKTEPRSRLLTVLPVVALLSDEDLISDNFLAFMWQSYPCCLKKTEATHHLAFLTLAFLSNGDELHTHCILCAWLGPLGDSWTGVGWNFAETKQLLFVKVEGVLHCWYQSLLKCFEYLCCRVPNGWVHKTECGDMSHKSVSTQQTLDGALSLRNGNMRGKGF